jgi:hypothetical protein
MTLSGVGFGYEEAIAMAKEWRIPFTQVRLGRFLFLLISILLLFVLRPFLEGYIGINLLLDIFFSFILFSGIYAVSQRKYQFIIALCIAIPPFLLFWSTHLLESPSLILVRNSFLILFFAYTVIIILSYIFREKEVTADLIMGAVCVYFFIGLMWALVFAVLESFQPGSFRVGQGLTTDIVNFVYYSFVTQTTLGYGDITPITAPARSLSLLEAVIGQLYLAVLIARLVGVHIAQSSHKRSS